jgi:hypothetical protein
VLNTLADVVVTLATARALGAVAARSGMVRRLRQSSGCAMCGLGAMLLFARRGAT